MSPQLDLLASLHRASSELLRAYHTAKSAGLHEVAAAATAAQITVTRAIGELAKEYRVAEVTS